jgi:hypothetical protein
MVTFAYNIMRTSYLAINKKMSNSWSDVSLETAACLLIAVIAYKIYRMRLSAESECCGGAVSVRAYNPGNNTPKIFKEAFTQNVGESSTSSEVTVRDLELGITQEELNNMKKPKIQRSINK